MELYISDHPLDCLTCAANGDCELQDMAGAVGLREVRYGIDGANHLVQAKDECNPYFTFDPAKCIVCSRCVRACEEVQGTFALTIEGRGFDSQGGARRRTSFFGSECVSCGACVQACPTATLMEKSVIDIGQPEHSVVTTCAYCGVGCSFKAEMRGTEVVRMVPYKDGKANHGHSCVKGRFAWGYATHRDRITRADAARKDHRPLARGVLGRGARPCRPRVLAHPGQVRPHGDRRHHLLALHQRGNLPGPEAGARRHAATTTSTPAPGSATRRPATASASAFGTSAGTQDFDSVDHADVIMVIGANPTDAHPVFASRMKARLRAGAKLIVIDPRRIDLVRMPHVEASYHLPLRPGTNVAVLTSIAHVIVTEGLVDEDFVRDPLRLGRLPALGGIRGPPAAQSRGDRADNRRARRSDPRRGAALCHRRQCRDLLWPWRHRAQPGYDHGDGDRQPRHGHRQSRPPRRRGEPATGPEQCPGRLRHGLLPA